MDHDSPSHPPTSRVPPTSAPVAVAPAPQRGGPVEQWGRSPSDGRRWLSLVFFILIVTTLLGILTLLPPSLMAWYLLGLLGWMILFVVAATRPLAIAPLAFTILIPFVWLTTGRSRDARVFRLSETPLRDRFNSLLDGHARPYLDLGCTSVGRWVITGVDSASMLVVIEYLTTPIDGLYVVINTHWIPNTALPTFSIREAFMSWPAEDPNKAPPLALRLHCGPTIPFAESTRCIDAYMPPRTSAADHLATAALLSKLVDPAAWHSQLASPDEMPQTLGRVVARVLQSEIDKGRPNPPNARGWMYPTLRGAAMACTALAFPINWVRNRRAASHLAGLLELASARR